MVGAATVSANDTNFTLNLGGLTRASGGRFFLQGIEDAHLTGGAGDNVFDLAWNGRAKVDGQGGADQLNVNGGGTLTLQLLNTEDLQIFQGTVALDQDAAVTTFLMNSGRLLGRRTLAIGQDGIWNGGTWEGNGLVVVLPEAVLEIAGPDAKKISGYELLNQGSVHWVGDSQVDAARATITNEGEFILSGRLKLVGDGRSTFVNDSTGTLRKIDARGATFDGIAIRNAGTISIDNGNLTLNATYLQTEGVTHIAANGLLGISGTSPIEIRGGTLGGDGIINGNVLNAGKLIPGGAPGVLTVFGSYIQRVGGEFEAELRNQNVGTGYDQLSVFGDVKLGGQLSTLPLPGFNGNTFILINNRGGKKVDGTFHGLDEGDFILVGGQQFKITYKGGDGNDVVLTRVVQANQPPVAGNDVNTTNEGKALLTAAPGVLSNDSDPDGDRLSVTSFDSVSALGAAVTVAADGSYTYDPCAVAAFNALAEGATARDSFTYTIGDGRGGFATATVFVTVLGVNDPPQAANDSSSVDEDRTLEILASGILSNDTDPDGDPLTAILVDGPANGTLTLNDDGSFTYTPNANFHGIDSFSYHANDGRADSNTAIVTIAVNSVAEATTTTVVSSSPVTITNVPVLLTATVGSAGGTPTGSMQFLVDGFAYGSPVALAGGSASVELNGLFVGQYSVTALYSGDGDFAASAGFATQFVSPAPTEVRVTSLMNPAEYGGSGTLLALAFRAIPPSGFFPIAPTGTITLRDTFRGETTVLAAFELGQPLPALPPLEVGTHFIVMEYSGDANFLGSISAPLIQEIVSAPESPSAPLLANRQALDQFFAQYG
ncbi:MAG: tandem-95 repeat protein [Planctomycetia bacterium]|nr:tandem-95 repeat protein [Planctomycetia bacterium]